MIKTQIHGIDILCLYTYVDILTRAVLYELKIKTVCRKTLAWPRK